jgi:hypothetical protein
MHAQQFDLRPDRRRRLWIVIPIAIIVVALGVVLWRGQPQPIRSAAQREAAARELVAGIRISTKVAGSTLAASKGLVDFMAENDTRLVFVRIVDDLDLELRIETEQDVTFSDPPTLCLIGPFSAPQDAGYESGCWGAPDIGGLLSAELATDGAGHAIVPGGQAIVVSARVHRGGHRCDYPPGRWVLTVEGNPLVDGKPMGARQIGEIGFDIPWADSGPLPFIPVPTVAYCGSANLVYREQGEPQIASPSP